MSTDWVRPYLNRTYLAETLDPVHIGTGEFRLGRVDNTIVREAGTNLPKIPGSSLAGVARAYTAMRCGAYRWYDERKKVYRSCAGKGGDSGEEHCGEATCRVCTTYGFSQKERSFQGLAQFADAQVLFFPVYTAAGPQWVTCPRALETAGCRQTEAQTLGWREWEGRLAEGTHRVLVCGRKAPDPLNLGWLYLEQIKSPMPLEPAKWTVPDGGSERRLGDIAWVKAVLSRLAIVDDQVFSILVDDQLEVRTSVSISPETGAAESGALFTAEAIPRACFLWFQVTYLEPTLFRVPGENGKDAPVQDEKKQEATLETLEESVNMGLSLTEHLGIGGVNTRGLGRLRVIPLAGAKS